MKNLREWPNGLGFDVTIKGRRWSIARPSFDLHLKLWQSVRVTAHGLYYGSGPSWAHAIASARMVRS